MSIKAAVGDEQYERIRQMLQKSFPGSGESVPDATVDAVILALDQELTADQLSSLGLPRRSVENDSVANARAQAEEASKRSRSLAPSYPLYLAKATHQRKRRMASPDVFESSFRSELPVVRIQLPKSFKDMGKNPTIETKIGIIYLSGDHLLGSIEQIVEKYCKSNGKPPLLDYRPERVDLITPARLDGARFAAIAVYLGYRYVTDATPSFYMFEAGTARGEAKMHYFAAHMNNKITEVSGYTPTPFSNESNTYHGWMTMKNNEPKQMVVQAIVPSSPFYIEVTVDYVHVNAPDPRQPALLTVEAVLRIATIACSMGVSTDVPFQDVLALIGQNLPWLKSPPRG